MTNLNMNHSKMREVLSTAKTIAVVGHSDSPHRTSYQIAQYLKRAGYEVIPVNPTVAHIDGAKSYASLKDVPVHIDIVNVFRRSEHLAAIVDEALAIGVGAIWTQLGVVDKQAQAKALAANIPIAVNLCIKVEHARLGIGLKES